MTGKLLIVRGINDPRCPIEQARIFRDRLLELGKVEGRDFEYVELAEEGHGSTDIAQKIRSYGLLVDFMKRSLWPVLAMLQIDSAGSDLPTEVRAADPTRATWSVPYVGVAFTFVTRDSLKAKMGRGVLVPIFTVAVRFPYYYPGNAASAFAAFFSDNNAKYVSANKAVLAFGVSIPLLRVDQ